MMVAGGEMGGGRGKLAQFQKHFNADIEEVVDSKQITFEQLAENFHLPINEVAKKLGVCLTVLKKVCRKRGIPRWPYRKLKSIEKSIETLKNSAVNCPAEAHSIYQEIELLEKQMTEIQENPSILGKEEDPTPPLEKKKGRGGGAGVGSTGMTPELASKLSFRRSGEEQRRNYSSQSEPPPKKKSRSMAGVYHHNHNSNHSPSPNPNHNPSPFKTTNPSSSPFWNSSNNTKTINSTTKTTLFTPISTFPPISSSSPCPSPLSTSFSPPTASPPPLSSSSSFSPPSSLAISVGGLRGTGGGRGGGGARGLTFDQFSPSDPFDPSPISPESPGSPSREQAFVPYSPKITDFSPSFAASISTSTSASAFVSASASLSPSPSPSPFAPPTSNPLLFSSPSLSHPNSTLPNPFSPSPSPSPSPFLPPLLSCSPSTSTTLPSFSELVSFHALPSSSSLSSLSRSPLGSLTPGLPRKRMRDEGCGGVEGMGLGGGGENFLPSLDSLTPN